MPCDPSFHLCVSPRPANQRSCLWSKTWKNQNTIRFSPGTTVALGVKNPLLYRFGKNWKVR